MKYVLTLLAVAALFWAVSFVRSAIRTFRFGVPFTLHAHRQDSFPTEARFGRLGAVTLTAVSIAVAFMIARVAIAAWYE